MRAAVGGPLHPVGMLVLVGSNDNPGPVEPLTYDGIAI